MTLTPVERVIVEPTKQSVSARATKDQIIVIAAREVVIATIAIDRVIARATIDAVIALTRRDPIIARAAKGRVVARPGIDDVIAKVGGDAVIARTCQDIVGVSRGAADTLTIIVVNPVAIRIPQIAHLNDIIARRALHDAIRPRDCNGFNEDKADVRVALGVQHRIAQRVGAKVAIRKHRHGAICVQPHLLSCWQGHDLTSDDSRAVDLGNGQPRIGFIPVIGQNVKGPAGICRQLDRVIHRQRKGLDRVAHDQQV